MYRAMYTSLPDLTHGERGKSELVSQMRFFFYKMAAKTNTMVNYACRVPNESSHQHKKLGGGFFFFSYLKKNGGRRSKMAVGVCN